MRRKALLICIFLSILILAGCNIPKQVSEEFMRTMVASTIQAKANMIASMTPPTETPTNTPIPSDTPTPTITFTPTIPATATWAPHPAGEAEVLVLYYDDIANNWDEDHYYKEKSLYYVGSLQFEQEVRMLYELGYTSVSISQVINVLKNGGDLPERPVMFTFDSIRNGQYKNAYPILKKYGFAGNLFVNASYINGKDTLSVDQIHEMMDAGWEVGSRGYYDNLTSENVGVEIGQSKPKIEELLGCEVLAFAYPGGYTEGDWVSRTIRYGYTAAFAGDLRSPELTFDKIYYLPRYRISKETTYNQFLEMLPWKEGSISRETMEWTLPTATPDPETLQLTLSAQETMIALDEEMFGDGADADVDADEDDSGLLIQRN